MAAGKAKTTATRQAMSSPEGACTPSARRARAQCHMYALDQAMEELGLAKTAVEEIHWKQRSQAKLRKDLRAGVREVLWVSDYRRADPSACLGPEPPWHDPGLLAHVEVGEALAAPGPGAAGDLMTAYRRQEPPPAVAGSEPG
jgi:hypothetical protein